MSGAAAQSNSGDHSARAYAAVLYGIARGRRSGVLRVDSEGRRRELRILAGRPVAYESTVDSESFESAVDASGLVPSRQLAWIVSKLEPGESLPGALLNSGALTEEQVADFRRSILERGVGAALGWSEGMWTFTPADHIDPERIDPGLLPSFTVAAGLWRGVADHVDVGDILDQVTAADAGDIGIRPALLDGLDALEVGSPLDELPGAIGAGRSVESLMRAIPDASGRLMKLLWLLEVVGMISRAGRADPADAALIAELATRKAPAAVAPKPPAAEPAPEPEAEPARELDLDRSDAHTPEAFAGRADADATPSSRMRMAAFRAAARDPEKLASAIRTDHKNRMGKSYYEFLDVAADASAATIQSTAARLMRRWQGASRMSSLPADVRALADELAKGCALVARTLNDAERRAEYDRRAARGQTPILRGIRGASAASIRATTNPRGRRPTTDPRGRPTTDPRGRVDSDPRIAAPAEDLHGRAKQLMAGADFDGAVPLLQRVRRTRPSDPDVFADLGWACYKARGKAHNADDADEFLRLAVTFDPSHEPALEYLARIAVDGDDKDLAQRRLRKLLSVNPKHRWARKTSSSLAEGGTERSGPRRFGFWKKD